MVIHLDSSATSSPAVVQQERRVHTNEFPIVDQIPTSVDDDALRENTGTIQRVPSQKSITRDSKMTSNDESTLIDEENWSLSIGSFDDDKKEEKQTQVPARPRKSLKISDQPQVETRQEHDYLFTLSTLKKKMITCGQTKVPAVPICAALTLIFFILILVVISVLSITKYQANNSVDSVQILTSKSIMWSCYIAMRSMVKLGVTQKGYYYYDFPTYLYYFYKHGFVEGLRNVTTGVKPEWMTDFIADGTNNGTFRFPFLIENEQILSLTYENSSNFFTGYLGSVNQLKLSEAKQRYYSNDFSQNQTVFERSFGQFIDLVETKVLAIEEAGKAKDIASLCLTLFCFVVIIPILTAIFIMFLSKEKSNQKQFFRAKKSLVQDTMKDPSTRALFEHFCSENDILDLFHVLNKINRFREYTKLSLAKQMQIFELTNQVVLAKSSEPKELISSFDQSQKIQVEILRIERERYELAFEIMEKNENSDSSQQISSSSIEQLQKMMDMYNNGKEVFEDLDILPIDLLDRIECEMAEVLSPIHDEFQDQMQFKQKLNV